MDDAFREFFAEKTIDQSANGGEDRNQPDVIKHTSFFVKAGGTKVLLKERFKIPPAKIQVNENTTMIVIKVVRTSRPQELTSSVLSSIVGYWIFSLCSERDEYPISNNRSQNNRSAEPRIFV